MTLNATALDGVALVAAHAAFVTSGVAIDIAACDGDQLPMLSIGCGCRVDRRAGRVTVFVNAKQSRELLAALAITPAIAVTFGRPSDHRSLQLKGRDARIEALATTDAKRMRAWLEAFADDMESFGVARALCYGYVNLVVEEVVAVSFAPYAAFDQTPGPVAGSRLS